MRARLLSMVMLFLLLVLAVPRVVLSQEFRITGVVVGIQSGQGTFQLQELGPAGQGRTWNVRVADAIGTYRPQDGPTETQATLGQLQTGDVVDVEGWIAGGNQLVARTITVRSRGIGNGWEGQRTGREIQVAGTIVDMDGRRQGILELQTRPWMPGQNRWTIRLRPQTEVNGEFGRGSRPALRRLQIGDFIEVQGWLVGNREILADEITVRSRYDVSPRPFPFPGPGSFFGQIAIFAPQQGAEITTREFAVIGQTMPGAQVRVDVMARYAVFNVSVASGTVTADQNGTFVFPVRPSLRFPGTTYTITVTSTYQGYNWPPVYITVHQS